MAQLCPQCKKDNPSSANFCMYCRTNLVDNAEMGAIDRLNNELSEVKETNRVLKQALTEAQKNNNEEDIALLQEELTKETQLRQELEASIVSKNQEIDDLKTKVPKKRRHSLWIFFLITTLALGGVLVIYTTGYRSQQYEIDSLESQNRVSNERYYKISNELEEVKKELQENMNAWQEKLSELSSYIPIVIKTLKIGNTDSKGNIETDYGKTLYSRNTMYLKPQIEYIGITSSKTITLYQKLFYNGQLRTNDSSPSGYTTDSEIYISESGEVALSGWGNDTKGNYPSGQYRYEIWFGSTCLKATDFYIY